jgi:hypothetical protein
MGGIVQHRAWRAFALVVWAPVIAVGCDESVCSAPESEPELQNVVEILPQSQRTMLSPEQVVRTCESWVACARNVALNGQTRPLDEDHLTECIVAVLMAAESGKLIAGTNENSRFLIDCIASAAGECARVLDCSTSNPLHDLCWSGCPRGVADVSCEGTVAMIRTASGAVTRDCARSDRDCDRNSVSGCNDALNFSCPGSRVGHEIDSCSLDGNWCEGDIGVGCVDGTARAFDCTVFGGYCQQASGDPAECVYAVSPDPGCASHRSLELGSDDGGRFQCVRGRKIYLE